MLTPSDLLDALIQSCRLALPTGTTLLKSGDPADASLSSVWLEFWVDRLNAPIARRGEMSPLDFTITVNCFGRPATTPHEVQVLAETVRLHLTRQRIAVLKEAEPVGVITLREAELRDLSRPATLKSAGLRQWNVSVRGTLHT